MTFYGVDCGGRKVAVSCPEQGWSRAYSVPATTRNRETHLLATWVARQIPRGAAVAIEPALVAGAGNLQSSLQVAETVGAVSSHLTSRDVQRVAVGSWKKQVVGSGNADKAAVSRWLAREHPALYAACFDRRDRVDQDRVDAVCIGLWAGQVMARPSRVSRIPSVQLLRRRRQADDRRRGGAGPADLRRRPRPT